MVMARVLRDVVTESLSWALSEVADNPRGRNGRLAAAVVEVLLSCDADVAALACKDVVAALATHIAAIGRQPLDGGAAGALGCVDAAAALRLAAAAAGAAARGGGGLALLAAGDPEAGAGAGAAACRLQRCIPLVAESLVGWRLEGQADHLAHLAGALAG